MKNLIIISTLQLFVFAVTAQDFLDPIKKASFGLNHHTNRDISYFAIPDEFGNIYNIGTTERDSTYTDIIITKLGVDFSLRWQKRYSVDTDLSYDIPLSSYLDSNNNLIIIGRSSFKASNSNGLIFILKYDSNGNKIWTKTIGNLNGADYFDYGYFNSFFEDDILRVIYNPINLNDSEGNGNSAINYLTIDGSGAIIEEVNTVLSNNGINSIYSNGIYYTLVRKDNDAGYYDFFLRRIGIGVDEIYLLNDQPNYVDENFTQVVDQIQLKVDSNENLYLINPNLVGDGKGFAYTKINKEGEIQYSFGTSINYNLLGSYIDIDNKICVIYEDNSIGKIINKRLDDFGAEIESFSTNFTNLIGSRLNDDNTLFVLNNNNVISLLNKDLSLVDDFNFSSSFDISDITKTNSSNVIVSGTTYEKMYPESDFFTQNNIVLEKISPDQLLNSYTFSGEGTSKAFRQRLIIDHNDNYLVISEEKLGPDNLFIGGSRAELNKSVTKYDSNLNVLWRIESPNFLIGYSTSMEDNVVLDSENNLYINSKINAENFELIKVSESGDIVFTVPSFQNRYVYVDQNNNINIATPPIYNQNSLDRDTVIYTFDSNNGNLLTTTLLEGLEFLKPYSSSNGDSFIYMYTGSNTSGDTSPKMNVYKNLSLEFSINLAINGTYGGIGAVDIAENGDLFFGSSWGQINEKLHRISLSNTYKYININNRISRIKALKNGRVFTIADLISNNEGTINIYDADLSLVSYNSDIFYNYSQLFEMQEFIFVNSYYDNLVKVLNQSGELVEEFKLPNALDFAYSGLDSNDHLILTGRFGNQIYTFQEYSWYRGFIHKYKYNGPVDNDSDGVSDFLDLCPDSPFGESVNEEGCSESQLDDDNDGVSNNLDLCPNTPNGEFVDDDGCSESQKDDDLDGVMNNLDLCPNTSQGSTVNSSGCFILPSNNFTIETIGETCKNKNNAKIIISAVELHNYNVTVNGVLYEFNNNLTIENLAPGVYDFCISVTSEGYEQCFNLVLDEGAIISGRSSINSGRISITLNEGTPPFKVLVNNEIVLHTFSPSFSVDVKQGDSLEVKTEVACEGTFSELISLNEEIIAFPNPTTGDFEITLPIISDNVEIELYNIHGQLILNTSYPVIDGKVQLSLKGYSNGFYFIKINLERPVTLKLIKH
ncbi:T9SS type A sorting domain-containing protein [Geojedonia litorea]|uniref:T9SS type A sorting domain-containing protein n=1 Tax=Geojedonia litorea TaxID=1268269 RepID=A0ABV9N6R5_9FLAO